MTTAIATPEVDTNVDASKQDAVNLLGSYLLLTQARKKLGDASKAVNDIWLDYQNAIDREAAMDEAREERNCLTTEYDVILSGVWSKLRSMPKGTVAPGGMTPQTVGLEFFNGSLNRDGGRRISAGAAKKINATTAAIAAG